MFSRAAKSVVKNLGQRKCYVTDESFKVRVIEAAEEIGQNLCQYAKTGPKLSGLPISSSRPNYNRLMISAEKSQTLKSSEAQKIQNPRTENFPHKSQPINNSTVPYFANRELDLEKTVTELRDKEIKLSAENGLKKQSETSGQRKITDFPLSEEKVPGQMWTLSGIAAVKNDSSGSQWRQLGLTRSEGLPSSSLTPQAFEDAILICGDCGSKGPSRKQENPCKKKKKEPCPKPKKQQNPCEKPKKQKPCEKPKENPCVNREENPCKPKCDDDAEPEGEPCLEGKDYSRKSQKNNKDCPPVTRGCK